MNDCCWDSSEAISMITNYKIRFKDYIVTRANNFAQRVPVWGTIMLNIQSQHKEELSHRPVNVILWVRFMAREGIFGISLWWIKRRPLGIIEMLRVKNSHAGIEKTDGRRVNL